MSEFARAGDRGVPDWVAWSAAALVTGSLLLTFGALLNPATTDASPAQTLTLADEEGGRWLGMAGAYLLGSVTLTAGLPALAVAVAGSTGGGARLAGRRIGAAGLVVLAVGVIATTGYAALLIFFRALVVGGAIRPGALDDAARDPAFAWFMLGWVATFYLGVLLVGLGLLLSRSVPVWVPLLMVAFVVALPVANLVGQIGQLVQLLTLTVAFTGVAMTVTGVLGPAGRWDDERGVVPLT